MTRRLWGNEWIKAMPWRKAVPLPTGSKASTLLCHQAELIFDMTTFKVLKNRFGSCDLSPDQAFETLMECVEHRDRVLLLV